MKRHRHCRLHPAQHFWMHEGSGVMGRVALLYCLVLLAVSSHDALQGEASEEDFSWPRAAVPLLTDRSTVPLQNPEFEAGGSRDPGPMCGIECQGRLPAAGRVELERLLSYETLYENGTRTLTQVSLQDSAPPAVQGRRASLVRRKRRVYGADGRFVIADEHYATSYPFAACVKISTGCSGILVSPQHALTAAHCVHDGRDYLRGSGRLRVGVMKLRARGRGLGRGGAKGMERGHTPEGRDGKRKRKKESKRNRVPRGVAVGAEPKRPVLRWTRVQQTFIPKGWMNDVGGHVAPDYDYALLKLKRSPRVKSMTLGVAPPLETTLGGRVHFSGFDDDHPGNVVYRFCSVSQESGELMYQYCDAQEGSSGAGVYIRLMEPGGWRPRWRRKVIGVFTGHRWVDVNGTLSDYNVAVRITPPKFAQICHWIHGDPNQCQPV